jgi:hypothetical protein
MTLLGNIRRLLVLLAQVTYYGITIKISNLTHNINKKALNILLKYKGGNKAKINSEQQESIDRSKDMIDYYDEHLGI